MSTSGIYKNISEQRFGLLVAKNWHGQQISKNGQAISLWECVCDCGKKIIKSKSYLSKHKERCSCGCKRKKHGHYKSATYRCWGNMISRCLYPSSPAFAHYKKRGISMCERWRSFENFLADMGERPTTLHTIDRIDNDGNYEPGNCRWATKIEQANNRMTNITFEWGGKKYTLANLARAAGVDKEILRSRLCRSNLPWTVDGAIKTPALTRKNQGFYC